MATYVIDGYNVMFSTKKFSPFRTDKRGSVCRGEFIQLLSRFASRSGDRLIVVFDGSGASQNIGKLEIIFSGKLSADEKIASLAKTLSPDTVFVSSDRKGVLGTMRSACMQFMGAYKFMKLVRGEE